MGSPVGMTKASLVTLTSFALAVFLAVAASPAGAQTWPARPIKVVMPSAPGGPGDLVMRTLSQKLAAQLGQPIVVENRAGAAGTIGVDSVAKSAPDGYTLIFVSTTHAATETLYPQRPYDLLRDLTAVAPINRTPSLLAINPAVPAKSVAELIALAKAQPGKLTFASAGAGNIFHLTAELFKKMAGVDLLHVPYKLSSAARTDVIGGQVDMMFDAVSTMLPLAQADKVRALATTGSSRSAVAPDLPTFDEIGRASTDTAGVGGLKGFEVVTWTGLLAPAGTPPVIIERLNQAITASVRDPDTLKAFAAQGSEPLTSTSAEFGDHLKREVAKWGDIVRFSGAKLE